MRLKTLLFLLAIIPFFANAQGDKKESNFGITFSGFVKNDVFYDTRQTVTAREGHFLLYPSNEKMDVNNKDINANPSFNILAIQSRLTGKITGPDAFGAKTSGMIEGAFFGNIESDINGFRLRHAFVKLNWEKTELLAGQYWNPMFMVQAFPEVISFNTGVPFEPFARNPQLRLTHKIKNFSMSAIAYSQRDFTSTGPLGASNIYMRNSAIPAASLIFALNYGEGNCVGGGADFKTVVPELETSKGIKTNQSLQSLTGTFFNKLVFKDFTWKFQATLAQNSTDLTMLGGYAVKNTNYDSITDLKEYTNYNTASIWTEVYRKFDKYQIGVFGGYCQNLGTSHNILPGSTVYSRGSNIAYLYRVSPRFAVTQGKTTIGVEVEYTTAAYGTPNSLGEISTPTEVANVRGLLSFIYKF